MDNSTLFLSLLAGSFLVIFSIGTYAYSSASGPITDLGSGTRTSYERTRSNSATSDEVAHYEKLFDGDSDDDMNERISQQSISSNDSNENSFSGGKRKHRQTNKKRKSRKFKNLRKSRKIKKIKKI